MGMYKLLIKKRSISADIVCECLDTYRELYMKDWFNRDTMSNREKKYYTEKKIKDAVIRHANYDFSKFLKIVTEKTGQKFQLHKPKRKSYDDWYAEASMDGTLAYSGVTDDF